MNSTAIPDVVVLRLPLYVRALTQLQENSRTVVSSRELGVLLHMTPAQIRKDLSYFGKFGKQGRGYSVGFLREELQQILGLNRSWHACLVGVGRLGQAIVNYPGFVPEGFTIVAALDRHDDQIGKSIAGITVRPMSNLAKTVRDHSVVIAIVAVPAREAQQVIDTIVSAGVRGILNYAPIAAKVPENVVIRNVDPVMSLQSMTFYLMQDT
jgi:redox-sensing transcriptional repressor